MFQPVLYNSSRDLLPSQLQGCCLKQCLIKQNIQVPIDKVQENQKKERKRRLSLYSISSIHQETKQNDDNIDCKFRQQSVTKNHKSFRQVNESTKQQIFKARRVSLISNYSQQKQNNVVKQFNRKGLRVSMANKQPKIQIIQNKGNMTPFRVNISRPSSALGNYDGQDSNRFFKNSQRSIKQTFVVRTPSQSQISQSSKRASTPSKRPNLIRKQNYICFNQIPNPTSGRISTFNVMPEPARLTFYKSQFQRQKRNQINLISDLSDIEITKKDSIIIEPQIENSIVGMLFNNKFSPNIVQKQFSETKRPQLRIKMLQQHFIRGGYRGSGRISSVYIVQLKQFGVLFASKQVFKKTIYQKDFTSQVQREIALHYSLQSHENIITLYQVFEDSQRFYFIQELSDSNLRNKMTTFVKESKAVKYIKDILNGLVFLHSKGIIHRHLKPQNILMFHETCKLSDFGWAPKLLYMNNHQQLPQYCSPQILNKQPYNQKTDLWSVGVIAYELITCRQPFNAFTQNYTLDLSQLMISSPFKKLIHKLLEVNQDKRATVHEAIKLIQQCK